MPTQSVFYRQRAAADREAAASEPQPLMRERLLHSAARFDVIAEQQEALEQSTRRSEERRREQLRAAAK